MVRVLSAMVCLLCGLVFSTARAADSVDVRDEHSKLYVKYSRELDDLARWCDEAGLSEQAQRTRNWLPRRDPGKLYLFSLLAAEPVEEPAPANEKRSEWARRFRELRDAQADALFTQARQAIKDHRPSLAIELVQEAARENPDHKQARRLLGYVKYRDAWRTPYEIRQYSAGKVWHDRFGWLPKSHVDRYEKGERFYKGRWISADEDAKLHSDIKQGWRIESEHYLITTNHSLEEGVRLSQRLERLYGIWQHVFVRYLTSEAELARWFDGHAGRARDPQPHNVVYYRSRNEYNAALKLAQPKIEMTIGIYFDNAKTAYFFAGEGQDAGTLFHEATHQLFQETRPVAKDVGQKSNFWIVEGIACYMESLAEQPGYYTLGGLDAGRAPAARQRLLEDDFYVPLTQLVGLGMDDLQRDERIAKLYSQSSGLADFLMHYDHGRYREALVAYLESVYTGHADEQTLAKLTGTTYEELDRQYRDFMQTASEASSGKRAGQ